MSRLFGEVTPAAAAAVAACHLLTENELRELLRRKPNPIAYDGFEPSGRMHIAQVSAVKLSVLITEVSGYGGVVCIRHVHVEYDLRK